MKNLLLCLSLAVGFLFFAFSYGGFASKNVALAQGCSGENNKNSSEKKDDCGCCGKSSHDKKASDKADQKKYVCPMKSHQYMVISKQGKCPLCKMTLVEKKAVKEYVCPMKEHAKVYEKPGKCSECGMDLVEKEKAKEYVCPMKNHQHIVIDKPGKCPLCKMTLVEKKAVKEYVCPMKEHTKVHEKPGKCSECGMDLVEKK